MFFKRRDKTKKRILKSSDNRTVIVDKKNRSSRSGGSFFGKILVGLGVVGFVGVTIFVLFFSPFLLVAKIEVDGNNYLQAGDIVRVTNDQLAGKYLNAVAKNNLIFVSKEAVIEALKKSFKRVDQVEVKKVFPDALVIVITEKEAAAIFCSRGQCLVVDEKSLPFVPADFATNELNERDLLILNDEGNKEIKLGENIVNGEYVRYLLDIKSELQDELNLEVDKNFHTPHLISGDIRVKTAEGWKIYFGQSLSVKKEISTLKLVLEKIEKEASEKRRRSDLEYIDLRTNNKVFYKFKNSEPSQAEAESKKTN